MWIDPTNANRMIVGHDQGVSVSQTRGRTWLKQRLPNAQLYHVTVDNQIPYYIYTNKQDGPSYRGPSNSRLDEGGRGGGGGGGRSGIPRGMWHSIGGGESGFATPDPVDPNIIWSTASGSGSDGGKTWSNVTKNIPNLPPWGTVGNIEASRYDAGAAYIAVDFHQVNNRDPFVYKTTDYGASWKGITNGVPHSMLSYAHCVREDPVKRGLLYLGTENGVYVSFDDGDNWQSLQMNLPHAPAYWLVVQEHFNDLVVGTYGRGAWILDDVTPLRELTPQVLNADAHLFAPRAAYRFRAITSPATPYDDLTVGENPPYGADINYYLKSAASGGVTITIQDAKGQTLRTLNGSQAPGLHRMYWDLRDTPSRRVAFRTP